MPPGEPPGGIQLAVFRILQEALTNALRHGGGGPVDIRLSWLADRVEIGQGTVEATLFGEHADHPGAAGLIRAREFGRVGDVGECTAGRAGALHFCDDADTGFTQCRHHVEWLGCVLGLSFDIGQTGHGLAGGDVGEDAFDDGVEHGGRTHRPSIPFRCARADPG